MSTKVITDPSALGWEQDGATANGTPIYKWAEGADNEHPIVDGDTEGQVTTWDGAKWTPDPTVIVTGNNVGIGTDSPAQKLSLHDATGAIYISQERGNVSSLIGPDGVDGGLYVGTLSDHEIRMHTGGTRRLTIDATGDATFSGPVFADRFQTAGNVDCANIYPTGAVGTAVYPATSAYFSGSVSADAAQFAGNPGTGEAGVKTFASGQLYVGVLESGRNNALRVYGGGNITTQIWANGDVDFSGTVNAGKNVECVKDGASAILTPAYGLEAGAAGLQLNRPSQLSSVFMACRNAGSTVWCVNGSGVTRATRLIQDGAPVIDAKGLITTLSTLRNATKDETTLEGMRDALSDAIGGLIEEFENQIATMPAEDEA